MKVRTYTKVKINQTRRNNGEQKDDLSKVEILRYSRSDNH